MEDTIRQLLQDFVLLGGTITYAKPLIKWLKKVFQEIKSSRKRRLK